MSSVYKRQLKTFYIHLNRAVRDRCHSTYRKHRYTFDTVYMINDYPYPQNIFFLMNGYGCKSIYISEVYRYYWFPNNDWNGGHSTELHFQVSFNPKSKIFTVHYRLAPVNDCKKYYFTREIPVNYVRWCIKKDYKFLINMVFPFSNTDKLPENLYTEFDRLADEYFNMEIRTNKSLVIEDPYAENSAY